jgi:predicted phosphoribosyltransferase
MTTFANRKDAGSRLAENLARYRGENAVVLALPRGGVVLGYEVARALDIPLDIVVVRKIGHPINLEYAIGAVDEKGSSFYNGTETKSLDQDWLKQETLRQKNEALRRIKLYRGGRKKEEINGKTVILVDDGIATGFTIRAAIKSVRKEKPKELIIAIPVAPHEIIKELCKEADMVVVLDDTEDYLGAVGAYYDYFPQVSDEEVIELLKKQREH